MAVTSQSSSRSESDPAISVRHLAKAFHLEGSLFSKKQARIVSAVANVSFDVERGQTLGIVGESGCGKSTTARCVLRLLEPTSGEIIYRKLSPLDNTVEEINLGQASESELRKLRSDLQIVFQDPIASFNPRMTVGASISEPLVVNSGITRDEREERTQELLELVGLEGGHSRRYPHEFSGGQRQRIGVARALALRPSFIVCDE
ncbi:MAG: ATP-binding cassette domain-containing protein, partial [Acidimicrobiales bacterium]|nr:ATP-binding cassette domain-containing protein [Acidimicrobiales bacterium]